MFEKIKEFAESKKPSMPHRKIDDKLTSFCEQRDISEQKSIELSERAKQVTKRIKELKKGIKMMPEDLPSEFQKALDSAVENVKEDINNEAVEIAKEADEARAEADNTLYQLRKESEKLTKKARNMDFICSIPLVGTLGDKSSYDIHNILDTLMEISHATNDYYESLLYSKNLVKGIIE